MELVDGVEEGRVSKEAGVGGDVLADVVAFGGAGPVEEAACERCMLWLVEGSRKMQW